MKYKLLSLAILTFSFSLISFAAEFPQPVKGPSLKLIVAYDIAKRMEAGTLSEEVLRNIPQETKQYVDFWLTFWQLFKNMSVTNLFNNKEVLSQVLSNAIEFGSSAIVRDVILAGADPNMSFYRDSNSSSSTEWIFPLFLALEKNDIAIFYTLLELGADINKKDKSGRTLLIYDIIQNKGRHVNILLEAGANPMIPDQHGRIPLIYAEFRGFPEIAQLLREYMEKWRQEHPE